MTWRGKKIREHEREMESEGRDESNEWGRTKGRVVALPVDGGRDKGTTTMGNNRYGRYDKEFSERTMPEK